MKRDKSQTLYESAIQYIPGGVNSPVRAFKAVGGNPLFFKSGDGAYLTDVDDNCYVDYVGAWGPLILGHRNEKVLAALQSQLDKGIGYGASTEAEVEIAKKLCSMVHSVELVRLVTSGTEATMSAIRLARGYTNRDRIVKFEGCYHGHVDALLVKAGSGALTLGEPDSSGVPKAYSELSHVLPFNDLEAVEEFFNKHGHEIACAIVEPIAGNMNCVAPIPDFLDLLREKCTEYGSILIFDEVMTGFRVAPGGAQQLFGVIPDLTTLGKVIGGGLPIGAFGGKKEIMEKIAPNGAVYQAGTLSGNPLAVAAGLATLETISGAGFYEALNKKTKSLVDGLKERADVAGVPLTINQIGGMFGCFFSVEEEITRFDQVMACNLEHFQTYFHTMLENGIYLAPSAFEAGFVSAAHGEDEINKTLTASEKAFAAIK
ncbi:MAG: glutamate-1-semialdehyde-2,1-aminomutase [Gammaproteobacteria bacterium]|nr:glutamate-1-semialdehyde-2,1-aminomutase [Gammaproteobacteria bacterium]|tara:strand:- start:761 stop:2050 length:1290 start_codon:yes stop_codon:yes gene_type:complete